eukprot:COSAG02_NODE_405_length_23022_cov_14.617764_10_plen_68_part_00
MMTLRLERRAEGGCGGLSVGARAAVGRRVHPVVGAMACAGFCGAAADLGEGPARRLQYDSQIAPTAP